MSTKRQEKLNEKRIYILRQRSRGILYSSLRVVEVIGLTGILDNLMTVLYPTDKRIGRNILKMQGQSENNNPKHWTAIYILPIQQWEVEPQPAIGSSRNYLFDFMERPKVLIVEPARTSNFNMFCIGFYGSCICMSKCMVSVILLSLTARNDSDSDIASG